LVTLVVFSVPAIAFRNDNPLNVPADGWYHPVASSIILPHNFAGCGRKSICLTNDHTAVGELVRLRVLSPDKVRTHEQRSVLEKCLGMQLFVQPDINQYSVAEDDYFILCSDGVWAHVEDQEFAEITLDIRNPQRISDTLIDLALSRDSDDNVSAVVVHVKQVDEAAMVVPSSWGLTNFIRMKLIGRS
jgi:serine/threonine protein phosphatase PrpC